MIARQRQIARRTEMTRCARSGHRLHFRQRRRLDLLDTGQFEAIHSLSVHLSSLSSVGARCLATTPNVNMLVEMALTRCRDASNGDYISFKDAFREPRHVSGFHLGSCGPVDV
jgi:hypothetical protein